MPICLAWAVLNRSAHYYYYCFTVAFPFYSEFLKKTKLTARHAACLDACETQTKYNWATLCQLAPCKACSQCKSTWLYLTRMYGHEKPSIFISNPPIHTHTHTHTHTHFDVGLPTTPVPQSMFSIITIIILWSYWNLISAFSKSNIPY